MKATIKTTTCLIASAVFCVMATCSFADIRKEGLQKRASNVTSTLYRVNVLEDVSATAPKTMPKSAPFNMNKRNLPYLESVMKKSNLSFAFGPQGQALVKTEEVLCPAVVQGYVLDDLRCEKHTYNDGRHSMLFFSGDTLSVRNDYFLNGLPKTRTLYHTRGYEVATDIYNNEIINDGLPMVEEWYDGLNKKPYLVIFYTNVNTIQFAVLRDFKKNTNVSVHYRNDKSIKNVWITESDGSIRTETYQSEINFYDSCHKKTANSKAAENNCDKSPLTGTWEITPKSIVAEEENGTWRTDRAGNIVLNNGMIFPQQQYFPKREKYCNKYPASCQRPMGTIEQTQNIPEY